MPLHTWADVVVFDEFEECLVRAAVEMYPVDELTEPKLAESIRTFLDDVVPIALKHKCGKHK